MGCAASAHAGGVSGALSRPFELVSDAALHKAVASISAWEEYQQSNKVGVKASVINRDAPLIDRVGGADSIKRIVHGFYQRLFADEVLSVFLAGYDIPHMRAKQNPFMMWLFSGTREPYRGKDLRVVHLKMIKKQGFSEAHYDKACDYFADTMRELGLPETLVLEMRAKVASFRTQIFTPDAIKDAEEEARWILEDQKQQDRRGGGDEGARTAAKSPSPAPPSACPFGAMAKQASGGRAAAPSPAPGAASDRIAAASPAPAGGAAAPADKPASHVASITEGGAEGAVAAPDEASQAQAATASPAGARPQSSAKAEASTPAPPAVASTPPPAPVVTGNDMDDVLGLAEGMMAGALGAAMAAGAVEAMEGAGTEAAGPPAAGSPKAGAALAEEDDDLLALAHGISGLSNI